MNGPVLLHERIEVSNAIVAMSIGSALGADSGRMKLADFMPRWDPESEFYRQSPEDMIAAIDALARKKATE